MIIKKQFLLLFLLSIVSVSCVSIKDKKCLICGQDRSLFGSGHSMFSDKKIIEEKHYEHKLELERLRQEEIRLEAERAELARLEAIKRAEEERMEAEKRAECERLAEEERRRIEAERRAEEFCQRREAEYKKIVDDQINSIRKDANKLVSRHGEENNAIIEEFALMYLPEMMKKYQERKQVADYERSKLERLKTKLSELGVWKSESNAYKNRLEIYKEALVRYWAIRNYLIDLNSRKMADIITTEELFEIDNNYAKYF